MEDIPLFGDESPKVHKAKDEKLYYRDQDIVSMGKATRKYLYALTVLVAACVGIFGYLAYNSYVNDVTMSQQLSDLSISVESSFSALGERIEDLGRRVTGLEEKTTELEQETEANQVAIQKTQEDLNRVKETQEAQEAASRITGEDAGTLALNWIAANIQGMTIPHKQWDFKDGKYVVYEFAVDNTAPARRVDQEIVSVKETEEGYLVEILVSFKGFTFTNDTLHWTVGVLVDMKGIATQKYINFAY